MLIVEIKNFGWNITTVSAFAIIFFSTLQGYGFLEQNQRIWKAKSGKSVSITWLIFSAFTFVVIFIYGLSIKSGVLMYTGFLALFHVPILIGLKKFEGFSLINKIIFIGCVSAVALMILMPFKDKIFFAFQFAGIATAATQPWKIKKAKDPGVVEIKLILFLFTANIFWFAYGFAIKDWVLIITTPLALTIFGLTAIFWRYYKKIQGEGGREL